MYFTSIRIITQDAKRLVAFYEQLLGVSARWFTPEFAEVVLPALTIAIGSETTMALFGAGAAIGSANRSVILELRVDDVDRDYDRLRPALPEVVQVPTTQPWGNRSLLFRDPDGNLINLFTPVTGAARQKFGLTST